MDIQEYIESGIIESYVLGMASIGEAAELEMLAQQHPEIMQVADAFAALLAKNVNDNSIAPPPALKSKIFAVLENEFATETTKSERKPASVINISDNISITNKQTDFWKYMAAASIILFAISGVFNYYFYNNYKLVNTKYQALLIDKTSLQANNDTYKAIFKSADIKAIKMAGVAGKETNLATVYWNQKTNEVYLSNNNLQQTPKGKQYQLWAIVDGKPVDAGIIGSCDGLCKMKNISNPQAFAVTLEKEGGSPTPTLTDMFVIGNI